MKHFVYNNAAPLVRHISLSVMLALCPLMVQADLLSDILSGHYKPQTMSAAAIDSVLDGKPEQRLQLRKEDETVLFRHSREYDWYLQDVQKDKRFPVGHGREALMSPNGKYVVYIKDNIPWIYKVDFNTEVALVTEDSKEVLCGVSDWLYEEEFGITRMFAFSPDSRQVAYIRLDETGVPSFTWQEYLDAETAKPLLYPVSHSLRYPKAGDRNAKASLCVYDIQTKGVRTMKINIDDDDYLPRLCWRTVPNRAAKGKEQTVNYELVVQKINRDQTNMEIYACNPNSTVARVIYREVQDKYFCDYSLFDSWQWLSDGRFIVLSEKNGWRQLFLHEEDGREAAVLTAAGMDVTSVCGTDESQNLVYYEAAPTPMTRHAYAADYKRKTNWRMTSGDGTWRLRLSADRRQAVGIFESTATPAKYTLYKIEKGRLREQKLLLDNTSLASEWNALGLNGMEFFSFTTERGDTLNGWMIKPAGFDAAKKYPVVMMQYSGPASQRVLDRWRKRWEHYLAQQGYLVVCVDPRGTDCRGRAFRNETYMQLGVKEAEDHISAARYVASLPYADKERMCLGGWSYGGYQTIMTMSTAGSPFKCGFAIAPVTDWTLYDTGYTERYMRRPQVNDRGYEAASVIARAADLQGRLLIVHGMADDNVHAQNTMLYIDALVQAGKQFEMQLYPDDNHFLGKRNNYTHLHQRLLMFLRENL